MRAYRKVDDHYELRIDTGRVALLGVGASLVLVLIFLLGVLVGKSLWGGRRPAPLPLAEAPREAEAPAPGAARERRPDLSFYDDLKRPDGPAAEPVPRPVEPAPVAETPVPARPDAAPSREEVAAAREAADIAARGAPEAPGEPRPAPKPEASPEVKPEARLPQPLFTVQVGSFQDRHSADDLVRRVSGQGVGAQVVQAPVGGRTWYRVQVGRFETRAEAEALYRNTLRPKGIQGFVTTR